MTNCSSSTKLCPQIYSHCTDCNLALSHPSQNRTPKHTHTHTCAKPNTKTSDMISPHPTDIFRPSTSTRKRSHCNFRPTRGNCFPQLWPPHLMCCKWTLCGWIAMHQMNCIRCQQMNCNASALTSVVLRTLLQNAESIRQAIKTANVIYAVILGGTTKFLQSPDISVHHFHASYYPLNEGGMDDKREVLKPPDISVHHFCQSYYPLN